MRMLAAHEQGRCRVTIGRFSDYGPGGGNSLLYGLGIKPAAAGRTARTFIAGDQPHTFHYLPDAARGFATLAEQDAADGHVWILPSAPARTQRQLYDLLGSVLDRPLKVGNVSAPMLWTIGLFNRQMRDAREVVAQFDRPYVTDAGAFDTTFGRLPVTDHATALAATAAWERERRRIATTTARRRVTVVAA